MLALEIPWLDIASQITTALLGAFATTLAAAATVLVVRMAQRYGILVDAEQQAKITLAFRDLLLSVEEWAHAQRKQGTTVTSDMKRIRLMDLALKEGFKRDDVAALRDANLPIVRAMLGPPQQPTEG